MRVTRPRLRSGCSRSTTTRPPEGHQLILIEVDRPLPWPKPRPAPFEQRCEDRGTKRAGKVRPPLGPVGTGECECSPRAASQLEVHPSTGQHGLAALGQPEVASFRRLQPPFLEKAV